MEKNKKIGFMIVSIIGFLFGIALIVYGYIDLKKASENVDTKPYGENVKTIGDLLFLCEEGSEDCSEYIGKYECKKKYCEYNIASEFLSSYKNLKLGVGLVFDTDSENAGSFLYDFKNAKKLSDEYNFTTIIYTKDDIDYFRIQDISTKKVGIINSMGEIIAPVSYDDVGIDMFQTEISATAAFAEYEGVAVTSLDNKFGLIDIETGKEILKPEYEKIGDTSYIYTAFANNKLQEIYVVKDGKGSLINYKTGEVVKEFEEAYNYVYPINETILVAVSDSEIDILENDKSLLETKIPVEIKDGETSYYLHHEKLSPDAENREYEILFGNSESNIFYIEVDYSSDNNTFNKVYKFDVSSKTLIDENSKEETSSSDENN